MLKVEAALYELGKRSGRRLYCLIIVMGQRTPGVDHARLVLRHGLLISILSVSIFAVLVPIAPVMPSGEVHCIKQDAVHCLACMG